MLKVVQDGFLWCKLLENLKVLSLLTWSVMGKRPHELSPAPVAQSSFELFILLLGQIKWFTDLMKGDCDFTQALSLVPYRH